MKEMSSDFSEIQTDNKTIFRMLQQIITLRRNVHEQTRPLFIRTKAVICGDVTVSQPITTLDKIISIIKNMLIISINE